MKHECHAHGCTAVVHPSLFMCPRHWKTLRPIIKSAIWREYRVGQEHDKKPSARYMAVQRRAIAELAFKPHDEQAAKDAAPYIISSERWRLIAIARGEGDPLAGISKKPITENEVANVVVPIKESR